MIGFQVGYLYLILYTRIVLSMYLYVGFLIGFQVGYLYLVYKDSTILISLGRVLDRVPVWVSYLVYKDSTILVFLGRVLDWVPGWESLSCIVLSLYLLDGFWIA